MPQEFSQFHVIEIPVNSGQPKPGVSEGSHRIWAELQHTLKNSGENFTHDRMENMIVETKLRTETVIAGTMLTVKNAEFNGESNRRISEHIVKQVSDDSLTLALGGDHSLAVGTVYGHAENLHHRNKEIALLWVDAHADINVPTESPSGNLHGMPVGFVANGSHQRSKPNRIPGHAWIKDPRVHMHNLAYIGLRAVDEYEENLLKRENVLAFYTEDVQRLGIEEVMRQIFEKFQLGPNKKLHVSFDIDALDPSIAPSTGTPADDGLTLNDGLYIMKAVHSHGFLELIDMVEVNPTLGDDLDARKTVGVAALLLEVAMGLKTAKQAKNEYLTKFTEK